MLKRFAETFAVLVFTVGLMAAGAALYALLAPESAEEPLPLVSITTSTPIPHSPPPWPYRTYNHPSGLWRIDYPEGWEGPESKIPHIHELLDGGMHELVSIVSGPDLDINVWRTWNDDHGDDLYSFVGQELSELSNETTHPSGELMSFQPLTLGGVPAYEAFWSISDPIPEGHIEVWLFAGSQEFTIDARVPMDRWNDEKDLLRQIVHSFQPLEPSSLR